VYNCWWYYPDAALRTESGHYLQKMNLTCDLSRRTTVDELDRARAIEMNGPLREQALQSFRRQIENWDIALPNLEPLVLDFGLGKFASIGLIEVWIANEIDAGYCGKYLYVADGQTCPAHHHRNKHETFFIIEGRVRMRYVDRQFELGKGDILTVTPPHPHSFTGLGAALLLELSQPCVIDDNFFADSAIPLGGNFGGKAENPPNSSSS